MLTRFSFQFSVALPRNKQKPMDQHIASTPVGETPKGEIDPPLDSHHEKRQNVLPQTQDEVEVEEERGNYAQGLQLLLICIPLCLCVFLVGLVSE
jgi:hypothetical protein